MEGTIMKKVYVCGVITVICIVAAVFLRFAMDKAELDYEEVKVLVVSSETKERVVKTGTSRSTITSYDIVVSYQGQDYDLHNAHNSYSYRIGATVTAYLSHGKLYANVEGVRNSTPVGIAYFAALIGSIAMFFLTLYLWSKASQNKRSK